MTWGPRAYYWIHHFFQWAEQPYALHPVVQAGNLFPAEYPNWTGRGQDRLSSAFQIADDASQSPAFADAGRVALVYPPALGH
jgi:hypothetical protein